MCIWGWERLLVGIFSWQRSGGCSSSPQPTPSPALLHRSLPYRSLPYRLLLLQVVLPEGARDAEVRCDRALVGGGPEVGVKYTYLDVMGRPTLVLRLRNIVPETNLPFTVGALVWGGVCGRRCVGWALGVGGWGLG